MKKVLAMLLAALMLCCTAAAAGAEDQVTLRFMWWGGDARHEATIQVIEKYMEAHPNVVIEPEFGGSDGYFEKLSTQLYSGTAADIIKIAMNRVDRRLRREHLKSRLLIQVHDELLVETARDEEEQVRNILREEMEGAADLAVRLEVDIHDGSSWYEAK